MANSKNLILGLLVVGFLALIGALNAGPADQHQPWHFFELLTVLAAVAFQVPGAVIGTAVAIAAGFLWADRAGGSLLVDYGRLAIEAGVIAWYVSRLQGQEEALGRLAMVDRLTGLHNYNYFIDRLNEERKRADRFGSRLALIMVDVDHLKALNEEHGYRMGNDLLKNIAEILRLQVRGVDIISRVGGEEFAALLPNTGRAAAEEVAERILAAVEESEFPAPGAAVKPTVSAGIAVYPDDSADDLQLIDRAEEALAEAKETGRNRVVVFGRGPVKQEAAT